MTSLGKVINEALSDVPGIRYAVRCACCEPHRRNNLVEIKKEFSTLPYGMKGMRIICGQFRVATMAFDV